MFVIYLEAVQREILLREGKLLGVWIIWDKDKKQRKGDVEFLEKFKPF